MRLRGFQNVNVQHFREGGDVALQMRIPLRSRRWSLTAWLGWLAGWGLVIGVPPGFGAESGLRRRAMEAAAQVESQVIAWRRDFHQHPELGNREFRTAEVVANHLRSLKIETQTGVAHTGVVGVLAGGKPGPVVALRADMDALPVTERAELPFASRERALYNGEEVAVMHACGHDAHVAILMGVAQVLAGLRDELPGTVKFIFQPAEEGPPAGEDGGARLMVQQGVLDNPKVDVIFGLHTDALSRAGEISSRPEGLMASAQDFRIRIRGRQTHGSSPWTGLDPVVVAAQVVNNLQTIVSRQINLTREVAVVTVGRIQGGVRSNIIPEEVELVGTVRTLDERTRGFVHNRIRQIAEGTAAAAGAVASVEIPLTTDFPVTYNHPGLTRRVWPVLQEVAGPDQVVLIPPRTVAEDFSFYAAEVPGFFFFLGGRPPDRPAEQAADHHTPDFYLDESSFVTGVKTLAALAIDCLEHPWKP